jgi:hypothetical protein
VKLVWFAIVIGCAGPHREPVRNTQHGTNAADAPARDDCYPYARAGNGTCLERCNHSLPGTHGCAPGGWPLVCNADGTCTPEQVMH